MDLNRIAQLGSEGVLLLCSDSTYAERPGYTPSEQVVASSIDRIIGEAEGRVIVASFASLISRIQIVLDAAAKGASVEQEVAPAKKAPAKSSIGTKSPVPVTEVTTKKGNGATLTNSKKPREMAPAIPVEATDSSTVILLEQMDVGDPINALLMAGDFGKAMEEADKRLAVEDSQLALRLFQKGIAQFNLAEAGGGKKDGYTDAGLSFMKVITYFPRSVYADACWVEVGLVNNRIGRPDLAEKLYNKAVLLIDAEREPRYAARLDRLMGELKLKDTEKK
jgi:hypothetical protein